MFSVQSLLCLHFHSFFSSPWTVHSEFSLDHSLASQRTAGDYSINGACTKKGMRAVKSETLESVELELEAGGYIDLAPLQAAAAATTARTVKIQRYVAKEFNDPSILGHCVDYVKQLSAPIWAGKCALALREAAAVVNRNRIAHFAGCLLKHANAFPSFASTSAGPWAPLSVCLTRWLS